MDKIISLFFDEGINRIIPGLILIGFYFSRQVEKAFIYFHDWNLFVVACIFLAAWLIGFMMMAVVGVIAAVRFIHKPCMFIRKIFRKIFNTKSVCAINNEKKSDDEPEHLRLERKKEHAEKVMCHVLLLISVLTLIYPPNGLFEDEWRKCYGYVGCAIFLLISILKFNDQNKSDLGKDKN